MDKVDLKLNWATYDAAKYACEHWHYSKCISAGKNVYIGVWENNKYIGCVVFGRGANNNMPKHLGVDVTECAELTRVALNKHITPVTKILSIAINMIKKKEKGLRVLFSYADKTNQNHKGTIYKAGNWKYHGERTTSTGAYYNIQGKRYHGRSARAKYGNEKRFPKPWYSISGEIKHFFTYELRGESITAMRPVQQEEGDQHDLAAHIEKAQ